MRADRHPWAVVMPVKRLEIAKTRLGLEPGARAELALAMAMDTALACREAALVELVVAVTDDPAAAAALEGIGVVVVADEPDAGLNPALVHGATEAARITPHAGLATIASDLPALKSADLELTLGLAASHPTGIVADASGVGTTLFAAKLTADFRPEFGAESRGKHVGSGAVDLTEVAGVSLRRDVDTLDDLRAALALGCGPHTTEVATRLGLVTQH